MALFEKVQTVTRNIRPDCFIDDYAYLCDIICESVYITKVHLFNSAIKNKVIYNHPNVDYGYCVRHQDQLIVYISDKEYKDVIVFLDQNGQILRSLDFQTFNDKTLFDMFYHAERDAIYLLMHYNQIHTTSYIYYFDLTTGQFTLIYQEDVVSCGQMILDPIQQTLNVKVYYESISRELNSAHALLVIDLATTSVRVDKIKDRMLIACTNTGYRWYTKRIKLQDRLVVFDANDQQVITYSLPTVSTSRIPNLCFHYDYLAQKLYVGYKSAHKFWIRIYGPLYPFCLDLNQDLPSNLRKIFHVLYLIRTDSTSTLHPLPNELMLEIFKHVYINHDWSGTNHS